MTEKANGIILNTIDSSFSMKTECESVTDVIEWLQSLSKYTSSLYSIQNIIDYYIKILGSSFIDNRLLTNVTNKILNILISYPLNGTNLVMETSLQSLCKYLDGKYSEIIIYFMDCLFSLFPSLFQTCIPFILQSKKSNHLLYLIERLMNSSLLCDDSLSIFLHSSIPIIQSMDFSSKESTFEVIDNFFFLFDSVLSNSQINQSLFIPFFIVLFHQLEAYHVLMDYLQVIPCSYSSLLWLLQSFLSKCDDSFLLNIVFILYQKYSSFHSLSPSFLTSKTFPSSSSFIESMLSTCHSLLQQNQLEYTSLLYQFLNSIQIENPSPLYSSILLSLLTNSPNQSFNTQFIQTSLSSPSLQWRVEFVIQHLSLFFPSPINQVLFSSLLNYCKEQEQVNWIDICFEYAISNSSTFSFLFDTVHSSSILFHSFIPYYLKWCNESSSTSTETLSLFLQDIQKYNSYSILTHSILHILHSSSSSQTLLFQQLTQSYSQLLQTLFSSYFTSSGFDLYKCINKSDYSIQLDPFLLLFSFTILQPHSSFNTEWIQCANDTDWLQIQSDYFRDDLFFSYKAYPSFTVLLCEFYYTLFFLHLSNEEWLIFAMELEYCLEDHSLLLPFLNLAFQSSSLQHIIQEIDHSVITSFLITHLDILIDQQLIHESCKILHSLLSLPSICSPVLSLQSLQPMKSAFKELAPRSFPSLKRKLSVPYLLNCLSSSLSKIVQKHQKELEAVVKEKENCSLEDWLHRLLKTMTIQYPASTIVTTITQLLHQFSSTSFSIQDWNEPPVFSEDYTLFIQGIESNSPIIHLLNVFQMKSLASDRLFLLLSAIQSLPSYDNQLPTLLQSLPSDLQTLYQEFSSIIHESLNEAIKNYERSFSPSFIQLKEGDAYTIIASILPLIIESVRSDPSIQSTHLLYSLIYYSIESFFSSSFELRSIQLQWIIGNMCSFIDWCSSEEKLDLTKLSLIPLIYIWCNHSSLYVKDKRKLTSCFIQLKNRKNSIKEDENEIRHILDFLPAKQKANGGKKKNVKRMYNRNPAVNAMLEEEEVGVDNYEDLADFIDPTPDYSLRNAHFSM